MKFQKILIYKNWLELNDYLKRIKTLSIEIFKFGLNDYLINKNIKFKK